MRVGVGLAVPAAAGDPVAGTALALSALSRKACIFGALFCTSALLHAAEVAITTLYPWKVKEFATAEGPQITAALRKITLAKAGALSSSEPAPEPTTEPEGPATSQPQPEGRPVEPTTEPTTSCGCGRSNDGAYGLHRS